MATVSGLSIPSMLVILSFVNSWKWLQYSKNTCSIPDTQDKITKYFKKTIFEGTPIKEVSPYLLRTEYSINYKSINLPDGGPLFAGNFFSASS